MPICPGALGALGGDRGIAVVLLVKQAAEHPNIPLSARYSVQKQAPMMRNVNSEPASRHAEIRTAHSALDGQENMQATARPRHQTPDSSCSA